MSEGAYYAHTRCEALCRTVPPAGPICPCTVPPLGTRNTLFFTYGLQHNLFKTYHIPTANLSGHVTLRCKQEINLLLISVRHILWNCYLDNTCWDRRRDRRHPAVLEEGAPVAKEPRDRVLQRLTR